MALTIPDVPPTEASIGEKTVFRILRDQLPDDCYIYYKPNIAGKYPDFIIINATLGILILEVNDWESENIVNADQYSFKVQYKKTISSAKSPLYETKQYFEKLSKLLAEYPVITQPEKSKHAGKVAIPIGTGAIMTKLNKQDAIKKEIDKILPDVQVVYQDELKTWFDISDRDLYQRLCKMFRIRFTFSPLTDDQINTIRGVIHPEIKLGEEPAKATSVSEDIPDDVQPDEVKLVDNLQILDNIPDEVKLADDLQLSENIPDSVQLSEEVQLQDQAKTIKTIKTLDMVQEQIATIAGDGHRLFYGVAGSGKTLILLARAKILASKPENNKVLILCFNSVLASYLRSLINQTDNPAYEANINIRDFQSWAKSLLTQDNSDQIKSSETLGKSVLQKIETLTLEEKWDAILIDEAHAFHPSWFTCCVKALKDPVNGNLMIVADGSQNLYKQTKFTWKSVGVKATGRIRKLTENYRNTKEIFSAAWNIFCSQFLKDQTIEELADTTFPVVKPKDSLKSGKVPILKILTDPQEQINTLIADIQECLAGNYQPQDLAIIYPGIGEAEENAFNHLTNQIAELNIPFYDIQKNKSDFNVQEPGIRMVTAKSSLGLEFKVVFIIWVEMFEIDEEMSKKELYVAMTRAQEELYLYGSGQFNFLESLASNPYLQLIQK